MTQPTPATPGTPPGSSPGKPPGGTVVPGGEEIAGSGVSSAGGGRSAGGLSTPGTGTPGTGTGIPSTPGTGRSRFAADELAIVLSHYDLGILEQLQEFPRGSRKAPKLLVRSEDAMYLLKRRARGKDDAYKVAFCHAIQLHLAERQFPLPHLIGTRRDNNSMLQWNGTIYELFEYIKGSSYDNSLEATHDAGKILSLFHKLLRDFKSPYETPRGSYHAARSVDASFQQVPHTLRQVDPTGFERHQNDIGKLVRYLHKAYAEAAQAARDVGLDEWPGQIVHCDWHPGNMLFRGPRVVAVIDYDAARIQQRVIDVANGALQFSILGGGEDPAQWPEHLDLSRFKRFIRGYDSVPDAVLSRAELQAIPHLMIEALIAESAIPIAATGSFARMEGVRFLAMVHRKVRWLRKHAQELIEAVDE